MLALAAVALLAAALAALALVGGRSLPERAGPPVEELAVEDTVLTSGVIELTVRTTGPDPVRVAQVFVNDAYVDVAGADEPIGRLDTATLRLDYPWHDGQPYLVSLLTSSGAVVEHDIPVAVTTPPVGAGFFGLMALLGTYVGIIPVLLGMLFLPLLRRSARGVVRGVLAVTVGLLAFLAVDGTAEGFELAGQAGGAFGGAMVVVLGAALAFLLLSGIDRWMRNKQRTTDLDTRDGLRLASMIAVGIGLHNLGEGLAIGSAYAVGELALGASLVVGFALHNTTDDLTRCHSFLLVWSRVRRRFSAPCSAHSSTTPSCRRSCSGWASAPSSKSSSKSFRACGSGLAARSTRWPSPASPGAWRSCT
jgi:zinc transporter ZupT